jgi:hypothetical protein
MNSDPGWKHVPSLLALFAAACVSILFGILLARGVPGGMMGFPGIYYGTQCLLQHCDPYQPQQLQNFYAAAGAIPAGESAARLQAVTLYVNLPTTFLFVAPFTLLPLHAALPLWCGLLVLTFLIATLLMWQLGAVHARPLALLLACVILSNSFIVFSGGNTAGFVVALTVIASWCLLQQRHEFLGVLCLAAALTIKPHDSGLVWLYFLIAAPHLRKRALQSAAIAGALTLVSVAWVSFQVPRWLPELRTNLAIISAPGGINEPGPGSLGVGTPDMIVDLQTVFSIVHNSPSFYNSATWLVCGVLFVLWVRAVLRAPFTPRTAWFALASASALSMLVTYHRSYDARLLLLAIPACALLWAGGGAAARIGLAITAVAVLFTADLPLTLVSIANEHLPMTAPGITAKLTAILLGRPAPLCLLATAIFHLWAFQRFSRREASSPVVL